MARARNIKPGFFSNDQLLELPFSTRILFIGLWVIADREGRLLDRPKKIKIDVFPGDDVDCDAALNELAAAGFIRRYEAEGVKAICIVAWGKHQNPHCKECASTIPAPDERRSENSAIPVREQCDTLPIPEPARLIPDSLNLIPDSLQEQSAPGKPEVKKKPIATATRLPAEWVPSKNDFVFCAKERPDLSSNDVADRFRDYWIAQPGAKGRKVDWSATWRNWVRNEKRNQSGFLLSQSRRDIERGDVSSALCGRPPELIERVISGEVLDAS